VHSAQGPTLGIQPPTGFAGSSLDIVWSRHFFVHAGNARVAGVAPDKAVGARHYVHATGKEGGSWPDQPCLFPTRRLRRGNMKRMNVHQKDLRHALTLLLGDVETEARHAFDTFRSWCMERHPDIEFLANAGNWPDDVPRCTHQKYRS
jgi:hypothetical protein